MQAQFEEVEATRLAAEPPIFERMEQIAQTFREEQAAAGTSLDQVYLKLAEGDATSLAATEVVKESLKTFPPLVEEAE